MRKHTHNSAIDWTNICLLHESAFLFSSISLSKSRALEPHRPPTSRRSVLPIVWLVTVFEQLAIDVFGIFPNSLCWLSWRVCSKFVSKCLLDTRKLRKHSSFRNFSKTTGWDLPQPHEHDKLITYEVWVNVPREMVESKYHLEYVFYTQIDYYSYQMEESPLKCFHFMPFIK